jgi:hypothetical protein
LAEADDHSTEKERRGRHRKPVQIPVWADPGGVLPVIDCKVIDISDEGAQVLALKGGDLPDTFMMQLDSARIVGKAHVVWRGERSVGVKFVHQPED